MIYLTGWLNTIIYIYIYANILVRLIIIKFFIINYYYYCDFTVFYCESKVLSLIIYINNTN